VASGKKFYRSKERLNLLPQGRIPERLRHGSCVYKNLYLVFDTLLEQISQVPGYSFLIDGALIIFSFRVLVCFFFPSLLSLNFNCFYVSPYPGPALRLATGILIHSLLKSNSHLKNQLCLVLSIYIGESLSHLTRQGPKPGNHPRGQIKPKLQLL
jgi:hypothetical protein